MARNPVIQVSSSPQLYSRIETYQNKMGASSLADACRDLLEFALLIKEQAESNNEARTNRELMEQILLKQYSNEQLIKKVYMNTWDENKTFTSTMVDMMKENVANANGKAQLGFEAFMNKENE
ncbi:hypothetical protein [Aliivibrio fischeri]|uniref:Uncharacterized protein n=1 Tax=Aliivibrio fischeri TaxID=668 RepID=A0A510UMU0_ALIFS|nr:hypothetical protein [Aliivibrio fischeri]GEK15899.1 hypothetical protein AFI02nite_39350 [Aliivibrio fischeri]